MPLVAIYAASKCAVEGFTESLSYEMELVGIRMRLVEPGLAAFDELWSEFRPTAAGPDTSTIW